MAGFDAAGAARDWGALRARLAAAATLTSDHDLHVLRSDVAGLTGSVHASREALDEIGVDLQLRRFRTHPPTERLAKLHTLLDLCDDALEDVHDVGGGAHDVLELRLAARRSRVAAEIAILTADG